jgi:hypothetical protein
MELSIPPSAAMEHRGSYSSAKSTLAAGIWTPPHSPTTTNMEMGAEESLPTPTTRQYVEHKAQGQVEIEVQGQKHQLHEDQTINSTSSGSDTTVVEAGQPAELRLSDFQVVDTLGEQALSRSANANSNH